MREKDRPNIFNGKREILLYPADSDLATAVPLGEVVADSMTILSEGEDTQEPLSFNCNLPTCSIFDIMFGGIESNPIRQFVIENFPEPVRKLRTLRA